MSNRFGLRKPQTPQYLWSVARLQICQISSYSQFNDMVWKFDTLVAGMSTCTVNWRLDVPDQIWASPRFQRLLRDAKRVLLAHLLLADPRPRTLVEIGAHLRALIIWMFQRDYRAFCQLDGEARELYFSYVCSQYYDEDSIITVVGQTIDRRMSVVTHLFRLRGHFVTLARIQISPGDMRGLEWGGRGRRKGGRDTQNIPAIPDKVFNPLMAEALRWVDIYSEDIIRLLHIHNEASKRALAWKSRNYAGFINKALVGFKFSISPVTHAAWRPELQALEEEEEVDEEGTRTKYLSPLNILRDLMRWLIAACSIVVQGLTGIRLSELLGLCETSRDRRDLPTCISIRPSVDDLNDVFVMTGRIFKGADADNNLEGKWVVGIRPLATDFVPEVVRALKVVLDVTETWREFTDDQNVFITAKGPGMPRMRNGSGAIRGNTLRMLQQKFLKKWADVPSQVAGWRLTTHQFRKKFAQDIVRCDPGALPAVREHFKHMSMHILETGYLGNDMELLGLINHLALREATAQIMSILNGDPVGGKMADDIRKKFHDFRDVLKDCASAEQRKMTLEKLIDSEGVRAWPCDFGTCLFRAETALCHLAGRGCYDSAAIKPLPSERCADRCCSCSNLVVSARNVDFWKDRYRSNERIRRLYQDEGNTAWALLASRRAKASAAILLSHGIVAGDLMNAA
ncbi:hypothetical protein ACCS93_21700 [Rhizobium ruizarguesonis]